MDPLTAADAVGREQSEITLGLLFLLAMIVVVLLDLHFRWAGKMTRRADDLEKRVKELERTQ